MVETREEVVMVGPNRDESAENAGSPTTHAERVGERSVEDQIAQIIADAEALPGPYATLASKADPQIGPDDLLSAMRRPRTTVVVPNR